MSSRKAAKRGWKRRKRYVEPAPFTLVVEYKFGPDSAFEKKLEKVVVPGKREGSGYAFFDDVRDVSFGFKRRRSAVAAAKRVVARNRRVKMAGLKVRVSGQVWP